MCDDLTLEFKRMRQLLDTNVAIRDELKKVRDENIQLERNYSAIESAYRSYMTCGGKVNQLLKFADENARLIKERDELKKKVEEYEIFIFGMPKELIYTFDPTGKQFFDFNMLDISKLIDYDRDW